MLVGQALARFAAPEDLLGVADGGGRPVVPHRVAHDGIPETAGIEPGAQAL